MTKLISKQFAACAIAAFILGACATANTGGAPETTVVAEAAPIVTAKPVEAPESDTKSETKQAEGKTDGKDPNRRICKRQKVPGSNLQKRVCASAARWAEEEKKAREFLDGVQKKNRSRGSGN